MAVLTDIPCLWKMLRWARVSLMGFSLCSTWRAPSVSRTAIAPRGLCRWTTGYWHSHTESLWCCQTDCTKGENICHFFPPCQDSKSVESFRKRTLIGGNTSHSIPGHSVPRHGTAWLRGWNRKPDGTTNQVSCNSMAHPLRCATFQPLTKVASYVAVAEKLQLVLKRQTACCATPHHWPWPL